MKNEERIIELLSEYLRKSDKHEEEIIRLRGDFNKSQEEIKSLRFESLKHQVQQQEMLKEISSMRSESLKHQIQQDVILKEILSISKRVKDLEET